MKRVVSVVLENASDTAKKCNGKYAGLCTDPITRTLLAAKMYPTTSPLVQTAVTDIKCCSKTGHRKLCCSATVYYYF